jgi:hercynylcysteine S-oxide lyase
MQAGPDDELTDPWRAWARRRPRPRMLHLDAAAAGRSSLAVLQASTQHALLESRVGAYVAEAEAASELDACRENLARLLGVPSDGIAFLESASAALEQLLIAWPFRPGDVIGVLPNEWGPNREAFAAHGLGTVELPHDADGRLELAALEGLLEKAPPAVVHLTQVTSHRALVQPVAEAAALCASFGVPLWVDAAQALGHVDADTGADVAYATSRKWITGPRGVGVLAVAERGWSTLRPHPAAMLPDDTPTVRRLESHSGHVAGRLGLGVAVQEFVDAGPELVWQRLDKVGRLTRETLSDTRDWQVIDGAAASGAITALRPTAGQDVSAARRRLLERHGIVTTAVLPPRAPLDIPQPLLRISPHVDCTADGLRQLRAALSER